MPDPTPEQIRQRAYELWDAAGRPEDREQEFWHEAERELKNGDPGDNPDERPENFTERTSLPLQGCGPILECTLAAVDLIAMSALFLPLAFARYVHRATAYALAMEIECGGR
jgi:Protein of unknown function (DUF2934)